MFTSQVNLLPQLWALDGVTVTTGRITPQRTSCGETPLDLWLGDLHVIYLGLSIWPDVEDDAFISQVVVLPENTNENSWIWRQKFPQITYLMYEAVLVSISLISLLVLAELKASCWIEVQPLKLCPYQRPPFIRVREAVKNVLADFVR